MAINGQADAARRNFMAEGAFPFVPLPLTRPD